MQRGVSVPDRKGLSPLARGNHAARRAGAGSKGPIPARAGQPNHSCNRSITRRAYPRSRGATVNAGEMVALEKGLSPLARGNRQGQERQGAAGGPIPARAGQPSSARACWRGPRAYPRSRGATASASCATALQKGLSPLARGNPDVAPAVAGIDGPIPARAGQPQWGDGVVNVIKAYPRSRGATGFCCAMRGSGRGLSPLARGNRKSARESVTCSGPIPARAGQPGLPTVPICHNGAYPRSRGATLTPAPMSRYASGLSPLARGNLHARDPTACPPGPIPARAGQPRGHRKGTDNQRAYPRSRGATPSPSPPIAPIAGLSPLARGNRAAASV